MKLQPLDDRVIVLPEAAEKQTATGILLPDNAVDKPQRGEVLAVGATVNTGPNGEDLDSLNTGDTIRYSKYGGVEMTGEGPDGEDVLVLRRSDILAVER